MMPWKSTTVSYASRAEARPECREGGERGIEAPLPQVPCDLATRELYDTVDKWLMGEQISRRAFDEPRDGRPRCRRFDRLYSGHGQEHVSQRAEPDHQDVTMLGRAPPP